MASATITSKGQITIPKVVRDSLMLNVGDRIEFVVTDKREALIRPISKKVDEVFGRLHKAGRKAISLEDMNEKIRLRMKDHFICTGK
jgi:AbrB family looped-hinge helix DNA binding protein